jgi:XTP/dITP diphosphohydrolase
MLKEKKILLATTNIGKLKEIRLLLGDKFELVSLIDIGLSAEEYKENGSNFRENAEGKGLYYYKMTGIPTLADDSGLVVDALGGAPGVYSARWAGVNATDQSRIAKLLKEMINISEDKRTAAFICAASFIDDNKVIKTVEGKVDGLITFEPQGEKGFGYDPVFFYPTANCTFAEMKSEDKNLISHRGLAFREIADFLINDTFKN